MIIRAARSAWLKALIAPATASSSKTISLLDYILIRQDLTIRGCDASTFVETVLEAEPAKIQTKAKKDATDFLVKGKEFLRAVSMMPEGAVSVEVGEKTVTIESGTVVMRLPIGPNPADYPDMLKSEPGEEHPAAPLLAAFERYEWAMESALKNLHSPLHGLIVESSAEGSLIGATNKHQIQIAEGPSYGERRVSIHPETMEAAKGAETVSFDERLVRLVGPGLIVVSPFLHPQQSFRRAIEVGWHETPGCNVPRETLCEGLTRARSVAENGSRVRLDYHPDPATLTISSAGADPSQAYREEIPVEAGSEVPYSLAINAEYLGKALGGFSVESANLHFTGDTDKRALCISGEAGLRSIILPLAL